MEGWIAPTDYDWYSFLRDTGPYEEANFWTPSDYFGHRGTPGASFLFKLKAAKSKKSALPRNVIAGFGIVSRFAKLEDWLAWECFGKGNGAADFGRMKARIDDYRTRNGLQGGSGVPRIGCIVLSDAVFFPPELCIPQPSDWPPQNLRPMRYDLSTGEGRRVWEACRGNLSAYAVSAARDLVAQVCEATPRYDELVLVRPRIGQGVFRIAVTDTYARACAVTGEHSLPALEAAHIKPYAADGPHDVRRDNRGAAGARRRDRCRECGDPRTATAGRLQHRTRRGTDGPTSARSGDPALSRRCARPARGTGRVERGGDGAGGGDRKGGARSWRFAQTYAATWPHEYVVRTEANASMILSLARHIFEHGAEGRFYSQVPKYHHEGGKVYWSVADTPEGATLINRCDEGQTYEARVAAGTLPRR